MFYELTVTQFSKMLNNMLPIFDKAQAFAEEKKFDVDVLLNARLAPDQFNLIRQVQVMCDTAKRGVSLITGKEPPTHADTETSLADLKERVESVVSYLGKFATKDFADAAVRQVTSARWDGQYMTGEEYAIQHVIPNFYFHMTTAYAIFRHNGVPIGKRDYLGKMPLKK